MRSDVFALHPEVGPERGGPRLRCVFQPIIDLMTGHSIGYEVLTRGEPPNDAPEPMFAAAREAGTVWQLELRCREAAMEQVGLHLQVHPGALFFLNVSPDVMEDPRFVDTFTRALWSQHGVEASRLVIEVTENHHIVDHERFRQVVEHYTRQGVQFAADDFGAGHSSLVALIACAPQFIKLDMKLVRDVHEHPYKRHLVRSLTAFAASVDTRLIAEGVETWAELEMLLRLGVRYAQGFLLAHPQPQPPLVDEEVRRRLRETLRRSQVGLGDSEDVVAPLAAMPLAFASGSMSVEQVEATFRATPALDHAVIVQGDRAIGLITRVDLFAKLAGRYAYALKQGKAAEQIAKLDSLTVTDRIAVTTLATRAMDRMPTDLYDPVIVTDSNGAFLGTVTMKALIRRSVELQVRTAQGANPLSGLPGNRAILKWIQAAGGQPSLVVVYADLDRFKEYNDRYGFLMGDELIRLAARVLTRWLLPGPETARLGHLGGDDFIGVFPDGLPEGALQRACDAFDREKLELFEPQDVAEGEIIAKTRRGDLERVPLVTLSMAVLERCRIGGDIHPGMLSEFAASLKRKAKQKTSTERRSGYVIEARMYR